MWINTSYNGDKIERNFDLIKYGSGKRLDSSLEKATSLPIYSKSDTNGLQLIIGETKFPGEARDAGISGTVFLQIVVEADGKVSDLIILKSIDPYLDYEAYRVLNLIKQYEVPPMREGKNVPFYINMPIRFRLR